MALAYADNQSDSLQNEGPQFREVALLRRDYEDFVGAKGGEIKERNVSRHYYHCDQWTREQLKTLRARGQNPITKNRVARKINGMVGVLAKMRADPKAFPRTVKEDQRGGADIATACMRYVLETVDWATLRQDCLQNAMIDGIAGIELELVDSGKGENDHDVGLPIVEPETFFYDPASIKKDFSDARYMGVAKTTDLGTAIEMFPHKRAELKELASKGGGMDQSMLMNEREKVWANTNAKRIPLVDHWYREEGQWLWCVYAGDVLIDQGLSPWADDRGKSMSKFLMFSAAIDHDGDRYGFVRNMKSPQDEVNHMSSKRLHLIGAKTVVLEEGAVKNVETLRREANRADGTIVKNKGFDLEIKDKSNDFAAITKMMDDSLNEIENTGPNPALMGTGVQNKSGRAINLLQQAGVAELGPFIAAYEAWELRVFRAVWTAVCQHWTAHRMIRVTDSEDLIEFIEVNGIGLDEVGNPALINALGELDVDIKIDRGPNVTTVMADAYENLLVLANAGVPVPPQVIIKLLPGIPADLKKELLELLEQTQQPDPMAQQAAKIKMDQETAKAEETKAKTGKAKAETFKTTADAIATITQYGIQMPGSMGPPDQGAQGQAVPAGLDSPASGPPMLGAGLSATTPQSGFDLGGAPPMSGAMPPQQPMPMQQAFPF